MVVALLNINQVCVLSPQNTNNILGVKICLIFAILSWYRKQVLLFQTPESSVMKD